VDGIHDHASGLEAAALIGSAYRNLHNLFDKHMLHVSIHAPRGARGTVYSPEREPLTNHVATLKNTTWKHIDTG
jgi:hypothetical protein